MTAREYEPELLVAGDTWEWRRNHATYNAADGWTLTYALVSAVGRITITAGTDTDGVHLVSEAPSVTIDYKPGEYSWQAYATKGTARHTVGKGYLRVEPDFATASTNENLLSTVKKTLDALDAMMLNKASKDQSSISIAGRSISRMTTDELIKWQKVMADKWHAEKIQLRRASGQSASGKIKQRL